jgi:hypothetical protein
MTSLTTSVKHFASLNCAPGPTWTDATKRKAPLLNLYWRRIIPLPPSLAFDRP